MPLGEIESAKGDSSSALQLPLHQTRSSTISNTTAAWIDCGSAKTRTGRTNSRLSRIGSQQRSLLHLTLGVSFKVFRGEPWDRHSASQPSQEAQASHQR